MAVFLGWTGGLFSTLLGLCVGSFANVVIWRCPQEDRTSLRPARSFCPICRTQLAGIDNIPVLAWILLRRRCRSCRVAIPVRYPAVELVVGLLFLAAWWWMPPTDPEALVSLLVAFYLASVCVIVTLIDYDHFIIPDVITLPGAALGLVASIAFPWLQESHAFFDASAPRLSAAAASAAGAFAGAFTLWFVGWIGNFFLKQRMRDAGVEDSMGLGDVKWMALGGAFLGVELVMEAIMVACFAGALLGVALKVWARVRQRQAPPGIPFGPFLSAGILVELAWPGLVWALVGQIGGAPA